MGIAKPWGRPAGATDVDAGADASGCADVDGDAAPVEGKAAVLRECCFQAASIATWADHSMTPPRRSAPRNSSLAGVFPAEVTVPVARSVHFDPKIYCRAPDVINLFDPLE